MACGIGGGIAGCGQRPAQSSGLRVFTLSEEPYLYLYLLRHARSQDDRNKARGQFARCLWQGYGLGPGLEQYLVLFDQGYDGGSTWLDVAAELERTGARTRAKKVYEKVMGDADAVEPARQAFEGLAHLLLQESREGQIRMAWETLAARFPNAACIAPDIKGLLNESETSRAQKGKQFIDELARTTNQLRVLQLCRLFDALWMPKEAVSQWQTVVDRAEPGTLGEQLGRVFLARAMLDTGKADAAEALVRGLAESVKPCVQAQSIAILAEIAQGRENLAESARLYAKATQIDRPTALPSWHKGLLQVRPPDEKTSPLGLQAQVPFFAGCNDLIDGDYTAAGDNLGLVAAAPGTLPDPLRRVLPCVMMLAYLGAEDYAAAEIWGYKALEEFNGDNPDDARMRGFLAGVQDMDIAVSQLVTRARMEAAGGSVPSTLSQDAVGVCKAATALGCARNPCPAGDRRNPAVLRASQEASRGPGADGRTPLHKRSIDRD